MRSTALTLSKDETLVYMISYIRRFVDDLAELERKIRTSRDMDLADKVLLILAECKIEIGKIDDS